MYQRAFQATQTSQGGRQRRYHCQDPDEIVAQTSQGGRQQPCQEDQGPDKIVTQTSQGGRQQPY